MDRETHRCAICAAEFEDSKELVQHEHSQHRQHAAENTAEGRQSRPDVSDRDRQNREFSRRNFE